MTPSMVLSLQDVRRGAAFPDKEPEETRALEEEANERKRPTAYLWTQQVHLHFHKKL